MKEYKDTMVIDPVPAKTVEVTRYVCDVGSCTFSTSNATAALAHDAERHAVAERKHVGENEILRFASEEHMWSWINNDKAQSKPRRRPVTSRFQRESPWTGPGWYVVGRGTEYWGNCHPQNSCPSMTLVPLAEFLQRKREESRDLFSQIRKLRAMIAR